MNPAAKRKSITLASQIIEEPFEAALVKGIAVIAGSGIGVLVFVGVAVAVGVAVGVRVGDGVAVLVGVGDGVFVGVGHGVKVAVISGVAVNVARTGLSTTAGGSPTRLSPASTKKSGGPPISHASRQRAPSKFMA